MYALLFPCECVVLWVVTAVTAVTVPYGSMPNIPPKTITSQMLKKTSFNGNTGETTNSHSGVHMGFPEHTKQLDLN